ncbi:MAG: nuclear transport factor 2 family protein [Chitinophagaceae bacterium]|nr:nuclear transport factor 2 family protein [Chitinophagaceae bacterium]
MKLTKKLEAEIKALMIDYWASYLNGNIRHWKKYLVDDYRNIGGTEEEIWNSKKEILDYTNRMIDQMKGLTELRNKQTQIIPYDPYFMVHELLDVYIKVDEQWTFYQKFRLSSLIQKIDSQWKVLHQHGSYPDSKTQEGEAFAVDEIKMENRKLKDAIKRRTIQLEIKNRELEIETSLEKVRAVAMGMHKPDDMLGVCKILFQELQSLGFDKLRNTLINSFPKGTAYFVNYDYSLKTGGQVAQIPVKGNTSIEKFVKTIRKSANAFHHLVVKGKELKDWIAFRKANKEPNDPRLNKIESLHYYNYSVGNSGIGISTYSPITKEKQQLLQRFRNVFQLAYQRYTDITLAEAQVREAQIETALERVRSRSLAMHNTSELQDVIHTVHKELLNLNIAINGGSFIAINSDIESTLRCWGSGGTADTTEEIRIPLYKKPFCTNLINRIKKGPGFFTEAYTQKEKKDFFTFLFKHDPWKKLYAKQKKETLSSPGGYTRSCLVSKHTSIFIINHLGEIFSTADNDILQRFGKVFEQSYTRFLDLQKAEAQAREAQIELGLERVRARAMAMQNSDELKELIGTVFTELTKLDLALTRCIIWVFEPATNAASWWMANSEDPSNPMSFYIKYHKHPAYLTFVNEWKKQNVKFVYDLKGRDKIAWDNILFNETELKQLPAAVKNGMKAPVRVLLSASFNNFGGINVASLNPLSEEHFDILLRFAKVFDLTYTRFNDLQKAEAQAKEARIETALERVRAVAMAMKKSDEVINVCEVMYKELQSLGFTNIRNAQIALKNDSRQSYSISVYSDNESVIFGEAHYLSSPIVKDLYRELEQSKDAFYQREFSGKKFNDWRKWREGLSPFADSREASATSMCFYLYSIGIGHIGISTFNAITEIQIEMLKRFKNVFELCYTRYIDVAKAEVQAREAQIELGLERVRARAMAMQHSDELSQLVDTVFKELANLDFALNWCIINIIDEPSLTNMVWAANPETNKPPESYLMKFEDYPFHHSMMKGYQERKAKHVYVLEGKEKKDYDEYLFNKTEWRRVPKKAQAASRAMKRYVASFTFSNFGGLQTVGEEPLSEESLDILSRFGKVFDLTYTRFNDLQKAEAQAREAEIELALERVRARTMAMQKSDELAEAASILFQQLQQLGIHCYSSGFTIWDEDHDELISWMCNADGSMNPPFKLPLTDTSWHKEQYQSWKNKEEFAVKDFTGKAMQNHFQYLRSFPLLDEAFKKSIAAGHPMPKRQVHHVANFSFGNLLFITLEPCSESHEIFKRFAKVFDQTYTRFLDLQKAEASAREAEIELALERVRARTMAMQHSEELLEVATVLFQQVKGLGVPQWNCGFNIWEPGDKAFTYYPGTPDGVISPSPCKIPLHEHPVFRRFDESRKKGVELLVYEKEGKEQKDHYQYMLSLPGVGDLLQSMLDAGFELPTFQIDHLANFAYGNLIFITYEHFPEMHQVFKRFARVFEQTYTRFLDLQKAEAQARDAKINLAVERVRARALAMFKSEEILEVVFKLKEEIMSLEIPGVAAATIHLKEKMDCTVCGIFPLWSRMGKACISL